MSTSPPSACGAMNYVNSAWTQVSGLNMTTGLRMNTVALAIEEACALFPTYGVWRIWFAGTAPPFTQLSGTVTAEDDHASARFTGGTAEDLVIDFGTLGLWLREEDTQAWHQIDTDSIDRVKEVYFIGNPDAELLIQHNDLARPASGSGTTALGRAPSPC